MLTKSANLGFARLYVAQCLECAQLLLEVVNVTLEILTELKGLDHVKDAFIGEAGDEEGINDAGHLHELDDVGETPCAENMVAEVGCGITHSTATCIAQPILKLCCLPRVAELVLARHHIHDANRYFGQAGVVAS